MPETTNAVDMNDGFDAAVRTSEGAMRQLLKRMLRLLFKSRADAHPRDRRSRTEVQALREKIEKWERQANEYEAMGLTELAQRSRESIVWYRRKLMAMENPFSRHAA